MESGDAELRFLRSWWEDEFAAPSMGNPLFESLTIADLWESYVRRTRWKGKDVVVKDGMMTVEDRPHNPGVSRYEWQGDELFDKLERMIRLGLEPDLDDLNEVYRG